MSGTAFKKKHQQAPPRRIAPDEEWCEFAAKSVAKAMLTWLKGTINVNRPVCTLTADELTALSRCAVLEYELVRGRREQAQRPYDEVRGSA